MLNANGLHDTTPLFKTTNRCIYVAYNNQIVGQFSISDPLRSDAVATINQLKSMGKEIHICTGADKITAENYAKKIGIDKQHVFSNAIAINNTENTHSKIYYVNFLQKKGKKVAMVGDGTNDGPALARAHLGIGVKSDIGDKYTQESAGLLIKKGYLFPIAIALDAAKATTRNIYQNFAISLTYNSTVTLIGAGLLIPFGFVMNPVIGVGLMILESSLVFANLYRLNTRTLLDTPSSNQVNKSETINIQTQKKPLLYSKQTIKSHTTQPTSCRHHVNCKTKCTI